MICLPPSFAGAETSEVGGDGGVGGGRFFEEGELQLANKAATIADNEKATRRNGLNNLCTATQVFVHTRISFPFSKYVMQLFSSRWEKTANCSSGVMAERLCTCSWQWLQNLFFSSPVIASQFC
ncbi:hypothetical protein [Brevifollis gellanilyticus]|uniref:Uncharacterized protein n=1 Tax=Brevifollis gellanilyticus TaxID=748831 RepID=A0A512M6L6_9BACT|nr:hypothetical protein [Brevifollis gellanilyticus]GEP42375.1 hypothetical protein BGE01nite_16660 [Brevifollis gellanilyticus]